MVQPIALTTGPPAPAGKPLFVSLLLYLDDRWPRDWQADTLFLDGECDVGLVVRPKRCRAVLMDQVGTQA